MAHVFPPGRRFCPPISSSSNPASCLTFWLSHVGPCCDLVFGQMRAVRVGSRPPAQSGKRGAPQDSVTLNLSDPQPYTICCFYLQQAAFSRPWAQQASIRGRRVVFALFPWIGLAFWAGYCKHRQNQGLLHGINLVALAAQAWLEHE